MVIFKKTINRILKNRFKLSILFLGPLLFIILFSFLTSHFLTVGIVDHDQTELSQHFIEQLSKQFKVEPVEMADILDRTISYTLEYSLIIEEGFTDEIVKGKEATLKEYYLIENEKTSTAQVIINKIINNYKRIAIAANYDRNVFKKLFEEYSQGVLGLDSRGSTEIGVDNTRIAIGFLVQFMIYMSIVTTGIILLDKENGTFYRIFYAPMSLKRYYFENLLAFIIVALLQVLSILGILKLIFKFNFASNFTAIFLILSIFALVCIAMGIWVISIFSKTLYAYLVIGFAATPLIMLGGGYWPKEFMPEFMQRLALFIPTSWVMDTVDKLLYEKAEIIDVLPEFLILLLFAIIFFSAGMRKKVDITT